MALFSKELQKGDRPLESPLTRPDAPKTKPSGQDCPLVTLDLTSAAGAAQGLGPYGARARLVTTRATATNEAALTAPRSSAWVCQAA